jgi:small GTP-binding protein
MLKSTRTVIQKKVCMLGDFAIGKTSLVRRYVYRLFDDRYLNTIGVNIARKEVDLTEQTRVMLLIWDLSGSEKFDRNRADYLCGSSGALLVCDLTRPETIASLKPIHDHFMEINPTASVIMVGNKTDLLEGNPESMKQLMVTASGLTLPYQLTSAKTGDGVDEVFVHLTNGIVQIHG